jgi:DNA polymerase-3 subunit beta
LKPIKALDEQPLRFEVQEYQVIVHHSIGSFRMALYQDAEGFFSFKAPAPDVEADDYYQLAYEAPCLKSVLGRCNFAMGKDDLRPVMAGVYFNLTDKFCDYVSSDGQKLVRVRKNRSAESTFVVNDLSFIIPYPVVKALLKVLPSTGDATVEYQKELIKERTQTDSKGENKKYLFTGRKPQCRIIIDNTLTISFNTVEGKYPDYWKVIPDSHNFKMTIDRKALVKSVDRLSIFAGDTNCVKMDIDKTTLKLETEDSDLSLAGDETLPCECEPLDGRSPISLRIGMKAVCLSQTLKSLSTEEVAFLFQDETRAVLIQPQPQPFNEEITMLIMPMLCND